MLWAPPQPRVGEFCRGAGQNGALQLWVTAWLSHTQRLWVLQGDSPWEVCSYWLGEGVLSCASAQGCAQHRQHEQCPVQWLAAGALHCLWLPILLWVLCCDFRMGFLLFLGLPIRNEDLLLAPGMWLLGWRWEIAVEGPEMVPNPLLPSSLAGYAGGRLGGRQNLLAGALQRRRLPGGQLHFHRWDRLQGKSAAAGICQVSDRPCRGTPQRCSSCLKLLVPRPVSAAGRAPRAASGSGAI